MEIKTTLLFLYIIAWAAFVSDGFNIDVTDPEIFTGSQEDFFGYQVLQYQFDSHKRVVVSAPLRRSTSKRSSGAIYSCTPNTAQCHLQYQQDSENVHFFGMSVAVRSSPSAGLSSCSSSVVRDCDGNSYLNGICYHFNNDLNLVHTNTITDPECRQKSVVFLIDGSYSVKDLNFIKSKKFIWNIITHLNNSHIQFAAVQFSGDPRTVFTFKDYMEKTAEKKLEDEQQMKLLTETHRAIDYVLINLFSNGSSGAEPEDTKVLVIITDGAPNDFDTINVIERCDDQRVTRFVIEVCNSNTSRVEKFASEPKDQNLFQIKTFDELDGILDDIQKKIYYTSGTQNHSDEGEVKKNRRNKLSQSGFSSIYHEESLILGAVGSNDWRGSLYEVLGSGAGATEKEIWNPAMDQDSYLGYSVVGGQKGGVSLLFSGAPRANHTGRVTFFIKHQETWSVQTSVTGEQVGSYFGASLCLLDVDVDGDADFLVIGAPQYYQAQPQSEGRMYIYRITDQMMLEEVQKVSENVLGQFAASVTSVADLNGDDMQDVAVGAPLEDDGRGAVYIYLGNQSQGIRPKYSQRILARTISEELKQFGVAIDGSMDLNEDELTDLVVGARGTMILLKARPVLSVSAQLSYSPSEINLDHFDCGIKPETFIPVMTLEICFSVTENTNSTEGVSGGLNVSFELNADAMRGGSRAFFELDDKNSRSIMRSVLLSSNQDCSNQTLYMKSCVRDTLLPVFIRLNFSQSEDQPLESTAVLNIDSRTLATVEVPFQRNCQSNTSCVADLQLDFSFTNSTLLVVDQAYFIINVTLLNKGDDSFNTTVVLHYPPGLSLSMSEIVKATRRTLISCGDRDDGALDKTTCSISLPVYRKGTSATFQAKFRISRFYEWNETMEMTVVARSENNGNFTDGIVRKSLPVQFAVDMAIILVPESSVTYLNFSLEDKGPKKVILTYKVSNLGLKGLPVSVKFMMPSQISQNFSLKEHKVLQDNTKCEIKEEKNLDSCPGQISCVWMDCSSFDLDSGSSVQFELEAQLTFLNPQLYTGRWSFHEFGLEEKFSSSAKLNFDRSRYNQISSAPEDDGSRFHRVEVSVKAELVIPPDMYLIVCSGGFAGLLLLILFILLLWKCGFFKRKRPDDQSEMNGEEVSGKAELQPKDEEEEKEEEQEEEKSEIHPLTETQTQKPQEQ